MRLTSRLLLAFPLLLLLLLIGFIASLPAFVSSTAHRAAIESLASSLIGRNVQIAGPLTLALLPSPQFIAADITITGRPDQKITAQSLTLDIAVPALLRGQLRARSLSLQSANIEIPWPLPVGIAPITPPGLLTALHAQIANGSISIGGLQFTNVSADIFTGGGAFSISGTAALHGIPLNISLGLGARAPSGLIPLTIDATATDASKLTAHLSGTLDGQGNCQVAATGSALLPGATQNSTGTALLTIDQSGVKTNDLRLREGNEAVIGAVSLALSPLALTAQLTASHLNLDRLQPLYQSIGPMPVMLGLDATDSTLAGYAIPQLQIDAASGGQGLAVQKAVATLPGGSKLSGSFGMDPAGTITGNATFTTGDLPSLLAAYGGPAVPAAWQQVQINAALSGDKTQITFGKLGATLGTTHLTGNTILNFESNKIAATAQLHIDKIDLTPLTGSLTGLPTYPNLSLTTEITADSVTFKTVSLNHLLLDATLDQQLTVRRLSASAYGGLLTASFAVAPGQNIAAQAMLSLPSGAPLLALAPAAWRLPDKLSHAPLAVSFAAQGPAIALASSLVANLGDIAITAAPVIDLTKPAATGAFTLRHPNAIAALKSFGLNAGLPWPGAGSIALRADLSISPTGISLPDFVLSLGDLTANGKIALSEDHKITADIDADTVALPPLPDKFSLPTALLAGMSGTIKLAANRVLLNGAPLLGTAAATVTLAPDLWQLSLANANLASGHLRAELAVKLPAGAAPALSTNFTLTNADAASLNLPGPFPFALTAGHINARADLAATGATPAQWEASLVGNAALAATQASVNGFDLAGLATALSSTTRTKAIRTAMLAGTTDNAALNISGDFDQGSYKITTAALQADSGSATVSGKLSLADQTLALNLQLMPDVSPPLALQKSLTGSWADPRPALVIAPALHWTPAPQRR
jgi:hypothetical protein